MNIFNEIKKIGKTPVIAQIGGFRPDDTIKSWFGGNFLFKSNMSWPKDKDGFMLPVIQVMVSEIPNGKHFFGNMRLIQVFINSKRLPTGPAKNGDGWLLIEHDSTENMITVPTPNECNKYKTFQIKWSKGGKPDYPCWEESWYYFDMDEINESEELSDRFFDEFDRYTKTKIGGYASFIQSPCLGNFEYVFQISSEQKPLFMVGDNGNIYVLKSKIDGQWYMEWDCY
jgi:hypothetical protein